MSKHEQEIEILAVFVHGSLAALHGLAFFYNLRRGNTFDVVMHGAAFAYDLYATADHMRDAKETSK